MFLVEKEDLAAKIWGLAEPRLVEQGLELVDLELHREGGRLWVRLFIDRVDRSGGGVTVEECGEFNTVFGRLLSVEDLIGESYVLEVSSPGVNRRLRRLKDFREHLGKRVTVVVGSAHGRRRLRGRLLYADEEGVTVEGSGEGVRVKHDEIVRANLEYEFPPVNAGKGGGAKGRSHVKTKGTKDQG